MESVFAAAGLLTVAALTPGPNNLVVMQAGARSGWRGALPEILGAVLGGLGLLAVVMLGGTALFELLPAARTALAVGGCLYLLWLGAGLVLGSLRPARPEAAVGPTALPAGVAPLLGFQFLNPKSWVMVLTAVSAVQVGSTGAALAWLAALFVLIPSVCLVLWAALGALLSGALRRARVRAWFDRAMGLLLVASALLLLRDV
ncbi:LysE family translocator [Myxococcus sp. Y35]|uniref:LysE family translocator n=1 Tax=Pseudomyxococcus flavus TaxID=3115648 RepID=UPI003CF29C0A